MIITNTCVHKTTPVSSVTPRNQEVIAKTCMLQQITDEEGFEPGCKKGSMRVAGVGMSTCCIWDKDDCHQEAEQASPAHRPKLGSVANVVEKDGWGQGT